MLPWGETTGILAVLFNFAFFYPLFMAWLWMLGGLWYYFHWERRNTRRPDQPPELEHYPGCSILLPCHNEGQQVRETMEWLLEQTYPEFEIIAINDASTDDTGTILDELAARHDNVRVIHFESNQGKAMGLRVAAIASHHEYLFCVDGDAILSKTAIQWMMWHFVTGPRVGAVTGNPRIRNRSTLLGRLQVGEFSSIIGLIKRAQRIYGRIFTVSGVVSGYRKAALHRNRYWNTDMVTEDIDVTWLLQADHWDVRYEPNALCWILMPETLRGLWKQRLRWAQGGVEVLMRYGRKALRWRQRRMWGVVVEYTLSVVWAYVMASIFALYFLGLVVTLPETLRVETIMPQWNGVVLGVTCLLQFAVSLIIDSRYEKGLWRIYFWVIWYPLAFWLISMLTTVVGLPKAILKGHGERAVWTSPDRGVRL
ncbi:MAG: poly-beta-1,6-N-acetyl-D-glucosamine synthase [Xanthomonadales bacterium]|nr:poly-beta-1,6-N-acetyl-D-glucosamine synthase [Xanthomonadales bacterium]